MRLSLILNSGAFSLEKNKLSGRRSFENNGIIYTRRGGFIDTAHVRDTADLTVALFFKIFPRLGEAFTIELHPELGPREIVFRETDLSHLSSRRRWLLAANLSARLAYQLAEAHEIAQWHGYRSFALWSEELSPESLWKDQPIVPGNFALVAAYDKAEDDKVLLQAKEQINDQMKEGDE